jgi:hypothetical protein
MFWHRAPSRFSQRCSPCLWICGPTGSAHFVGGVLTAVAPRIAQHVIEMRSAHRYFGARQVRSHFGRNAPQLRIEPQAGFPATQEPLSPEAPLGTVARPLRTFCGSRSPDWRPPPHPAAGHRSDFPRERTAWCGGELHALRLDPSGEVVHLFPRFSREQRVLDLPSLSAAPRSAAHRAIEAVQSGGRRHLRTPA